MYVNRLMLVIDSASILTDPDEVPILFARWPDMLFGTVLIKAL